jgi:hypothetical protein
MPDRHTGTAVAKFHDERDILGDLEEESHARASQSRRERAEFPVW